MHTQPQATPVPSPSDDVHAKEPVKLDIQVRRLERIAATGATAGRGMLAAVFGATIS